MAHLQGTCMHMCPKSEISFRRKNNFVHSLEKNGKYIKEFSRCAAGRKEPLASDLRPPKILLKTMTYLMKEILTKEDISFSTIYEFINDRIQAIRQDLAIQDITDHNAVFIYERAIKFYIVFHVLLQGEPLSDFDPVLNQQQLYICLQKLLSLYEVMEDCSHQTEFLAIYAAHNLGDKKEHITILRTGAKDDHPLNMVVLLNQAFMDGNFIRFFKVYEKLPLILQLTCFRHLHSMRIRTLKVVCAAYGIKNCKFPVDVLCHFLNLSIKDTERLCKNHSLTINDNHLINFKRSSVNTAMIDKTSCSSEVSMFQRKIHESIVELCNA